MDTPPLVTLDLGWTPVKDTELTLGKHGEEVSYLTSIISRHHKGLNRAALIVSCLARSQISGRYGWWARWFIPHEKLIVPPLTIILYTPISQTMEYQNQEQRGNYRFISYLLVTALQQQIVAT
ncbi:hypothetical protein CEXT_86011 [Caerostris extrusa]|uniref:Uncharacterized protein n=1 Tax=Caerostris extrusa TaxID=172846 RepID=A0AAV4Y587_CAEEX|nr:hypothetical protein CEXT_86011 [Caerostris extrusa]